MPIDVRAEVSNVCKQGMDSYSLRLPSGDDGAILEEGCEAWVYAREALRLRISRFVSRARRMLMDGTFFTISKGIGDKVKESVLRSLWR